MPSGLNATPKTALPLRAAKAWHRSWRTTQRYVRVTEDDVAKLTADHDPNRRRQ